MYFLKFLIFFLILHSDCETFLLNFPVIAMVIWTLAELRIYVPPDTK